MQLAGVEIPVIQDQPHSLRGLWTCLMGWVGDTGLTECSAGPKSCPIHMSHYYVSQLTSCKTMALTIPERWQRKKTQIRKNNFQVCHHGSKRTAQEIRSSKCGKQTLFCSGRTAFRVHLSHIHGNLVGDTGDRTKLLEIKGQSRIMLRQRKNWV